MKELVFIVGEESSDQQRLHQCLSKAGYRVERFAVEAIGNERPQVRPTLIIISCVSPQSDGLDLVRRLRHHPYMSAVPLIVLIAEGDPEQRIRCLESGADECLMKPINPGELVMRVGAVRRSAQPSWSVPWVEDAGLVIDTAAMQLIVRGKEVATTTLEFRLVDYLARHHGRVFTRDALLQAIWGDSQFVTPRTVDACVRRVRHKIEPDKSYPTYLKTIRGVGYRMDAIARWNTNTGEICDCSFCWSARRGSGVPRRRRVS